VGVVVEGSVEPADRDGGALLPPLLPTLVVDNVLPIVGADPGVGVVGGLAIPLLGPWLASLLGATQFGSVEPGVHVPPPPEEGIFSGLVGLVGLVGFAALVAPAGPVGLVEPPGLAGTVELVGPLG
jgi:hypothetical protein